MIRVLRQLLLCLWIGSACTAFAADDDDDHPPAAPTPASQGIRVPSTALRDLGLAVGTVQSRALTPVIETPGVVEAAPSAISVVTSAFTGRVVSVDVQVGEAVTPGQALAQVVSADFVRAWGKVRSTQAAAMGARASAEAALAAARRAAQLGGGAVSGAESQRREAEALQLESAATAAEADRSAAATDLRAAGLDDDAIAAAARGVPAPLLSVHARQLGVVTQLTLVVGGDVGPGVSSGATIVDPSRLWVYADLPGAQLDAITAGDPVAIIVRDRRLTGHVIVVPPTVAADSLLGRIAVAVDGDATLRPGEQAHLAISRQNDDSARVTAVPESAVLHVGDDDVVFVSHQDGDQLRFAPRTVVLGPTIGGWRGVVSGLTSGEEVVVTGAVLLKAELAKGALKDND